VNEGSLKEGFFRYGSEKYGKENLFELRNGNSQVGSLLRPWSRFCFRQKVLFNGSRLDPPSNMRPNIS